MAAYSLIAIALLLVAYVIGLVLSKRPKLPPGTKRPPGPRGLPWIGRIHDLPDKHTWLKWADWADEYGPIYSQTMTGVEHIWVSKETMVLDILAKNGQVASDRPAAFPNVPGTKDWKYLPLLGYHDTWRRQRKFTNLIFGQAHEADYWSYSNIEIPRVLAALVKNGDLWSAQVDQFQARFLSRCAFGTPEHASAMCTNAFRLLINISPGGRASNIVPGASILPKWLAWWQVDEQDRQDREMALYEKCQNNVRNELAEGTAPPSFTRTYLEQKDRFGFPTDIEGAFNVGMVSMAGIHTTSSPFHTFFLAMTLYPEWMARLQKDVDAVCGDRMPVLADMPKLPLVRAVTKECIRWRPAVPTGIPHELQDDIIYDGYFLPKGSWVHPMEWKMSRDPEVYPEPEKFNPDRFLDPRYPTYKEPLEQFPTLHGHHQFGFGRRICQGVNIVQAQCFCLFAAVAWAFDIKRRRDEKGVEIPVPELDYIPLLITKPQPFHMDMVPRSDARKAQIMQELALVEEKDPFLQRGQ